MSITIHLDNSSPVRDQTSFQVHQFLKYLYLIFIILSLNGCKGRLRPENEIIDVWYGKDQQFGKLGKPQQQINILGNIDAPFADPHAYYTLNQDDTRHPLTLGGDLHRLAELGDFNVEIYREDLLTGDNKLQIIVARDGRVQARTEVNIRYYPDRTWPLPYRIVWSAVENIQDVVEVVDGHWELTGDGIRTKHKFYDRVLAIGDLSWSDYEVSTSVIFHGYNPPKKGPNITNVSHVAIATLWPGHDRDSLQPNRKWHPLGATAEFRITDDYDSCRWRIFDGEHFRVEQEFSKYRKISPGIRYAMKHRVENTTDSTMRYSVKFWKAEAPEPEPWDLQAIEVYGKGRPKETGSALLIAHHTDVTFGDVDVKPIISKP